MTILSHSAFLQALGWAIANSLWQMALLWTLYQVGFTLVKKTSATIRTTAATVTLLTGFAWFVTSLVQHYTWLKQSLWLLHNTMYDATIASAITQNNTASPHSFAGFLQWAIHLCNIYLPYLSAAYLLVLSFLLLRLSKAYRETQSVRQKGLVKIEASWRVYVQQMAFQIGIRKNVRIWLSELVDVPATMGYLKPLILLPITSFSHLSTEQVEAIILHELAHIKRNDYLLNLLNTVVETILFFNPFAQLLARHIRQERENSCDDFVLQFRYNPHVYASALLSLEQQRLDIPEFAMAARNNKTDLLDRIKRIMNVPTRSMNYGQKLIAMLITACIMTSFAWLSPAKDRKVRPETVQRAMLTPRLELFPRLPSLLTFTPTHRQDNTGATIKAPAPPPPSAPVHEGLVSMLTKAKVAAAMEEAGETQSIARTNQADAIYVEDNQLKNNNIAITIPDEVKVTDNQLNAAQPILIDLKPVAFHFNNDSAWNMVNNDNWQFVVLRNDSLSSARKAVLARKKAEYFRAMVEVHVKRKAATIRANKIVDQINWEAIQQQLKQNGHNLVEISQIKSILKAQLVQVNLKAVDQQVTFELDSLQTIVNDRLAKLNYSLSWSGNENTQNNTFHVAPRHQAAPTTPTATNAPDAPQKYLSINPASAGSYSGITTGVNAAFSNPIYREQVQVDLHGKSNKTKTRVRNLDIDDDETDWQQQPSYSSEEAISLRKMLVTDKLIVKDKPFRISRDHNGLFINGTMLNEQVFNKYRQVFNGRNFYINGNKNRLEIGVD